MNFDKKISIAIHLLIILFYWERLYYRSQLEDFNMYIELICNNTRIEIGVATLPPPIENTPHSTCTYK